MFDMDTNQLHQRQRALHDSTFFFVGPFDDSSFCRGPQCLKPIATSFTKPTTSQSTSSCASPLSDSDHEDFVVLDDDDEYSEDELPPSPRRRHSGAMSISSEDLPFCLDRAALKRDAAAHRAKHHHQSQSQSQSQSPESCAAHTGPFAAHEKWDTELDGPHMALWVPGSEAPLDRKRKRMSQTATMAASRARQQVQIQQPASEIDGPMMALWGI